MPISTGQTIPDSKVMTLADGNPQETTTHAMLGQGKVALFAVPGAFTPTCSAQHLPGFLDKADALREKGIDKIVCMAVNDPFVMQAWAESQNASGKVDLLADGNATFTEALGLELDGSGFGLGKRSQRFSAVLENGVVTQLNVDEGGGLDKSSAETMLAQL